MKRPENEKTRELTQKLYDKSIKGEERRRLADELAKERYRLDKRKPMSHKAYAAGNIGVGLLVMAVGVLYFIGAAGGIEGLEINHGIQMGTDAFRFYMIFYGMLTVLMLFVSIISQCFKKEPDDEMSRYDKGRAAVTAAYSTLAVCALLYLFIEKFTDDIVFGKEVLLFALLFITGLYMVSDAVAFLIYEMKSGSTEDE